MPELPEVQTTVAGLQKKLPGKKITSAWSDLQKVGHRKKNEIKNLSFWKKFQANTIGSKILSVKRVGKNIVININNSKSILIHMKMTGHLLFGKYKYSKKDNAWRPISPKGLMDPYNRFIHLVFSLSDKNFLALCDSRKFAKVTIISTVDLKNSTELRDVAYDVLQNEITKKGFIKRVKEKPTWVIKKVLLDQSIVSGIGNIYADETLFASSINPKQKVSHLSDLKLGLIYKNAVRLLRKGISFGGDSMSDYRNIYGEPGAFHLHHKVYRRTGEKCSMKNCHGKITREIVTGRGTHFCDTHQKYLLK